MLTKRIYQLYYETPGGASAPGVPAPGAAPAQPNTPQPGAPGQGQGQGGDGFRQTFFPNVPDEQWNIVAPHMEGINKHVTQLQQRYAPLNSYTPEAVQGLASFAQAFDQDPVGQWVNLARMLQQRGVPGLSDLDVDHLEALIRGEDPDAGNVAPEPIAGLEGLPPEVQTLVGDLQQQVQSMRERLDGQDQTAQQRQEDAALARNLSWMRNQLKEAGLDESLLTEQRLLASFVAHRGNAQAAVKDMQDLRSGMLQGYVQQADPAQRRQPLDTTKRGVPEAGKRPANNGGRRGMFAGVSNAAEQYLRTQDKE